MKYHLSENGPAPCRAAKKPCPIGGEHYNTLEEAEREYKERNSYETVPSLSKTTNKAIDNDGIPLKLYHGSKSIIQDFSNDFTGKGNDSFGSGFYFTTNENTARGYGELTTVTVNITNPIIVDGTKGNLNDYYIPKDQVREIVKNHPDIYNQPDDENMNPLGDYLHEYWEKDRTKEEMNKLIDKMVDEYMSDTDFHTLENFFGKDYSHNFREGFTAQTGFDGVKVIFEKEEDTFWVAWQPEQITVEND